MPSSKLKADWRIWLGLNLTAGWLVLGAVYISNTVGWSNFGSLPADQLGSFLEGAFAPLAFLWLVIGYFLQQQELQQNTNAIADQGRQITRSAEQAEIQSQRMAESELHARQQAFMQVATMVRRQLGSIGGLLYISSQGANSDGNVTAEEMSQLFNQQAGNDDSEVFSRRLLELNLTADSPEQFDLFYGTAVRARHSNHFIFAFERMLRRAAEVDGDNMLRDAIQASAHGFVYTMAKRHQNNAPAELANIEATGIHIDLTLTTPDPATASSSATTNT